MLAVSVVMCAYNEEENIAPVAAEALAFLRHAGIDWELILVDDGSKDRTAQRMADVAATEPRVRVVSYQPNRGIGGALRAGFDAAAKEWITWLPADGQVPPDGLGRLFALVEADPSIGIVTSHFPRRFDGADNLLRKALSRGLRGLMWVCTGVSRTMDGIYLIRRDTFRALPLRSQSFFVNLELPIRAIRAGIVPAAAELEVKPRRAGASKVLNLAQIRLVARETVLLGADLRLGLRR